ncbi:hypothetical protein [Methylohalobius crimeensis]|uniref:hypothetical protein n=1 Tax=Methylohalobius crimeensis TaxID=244365 RepID=UPI0003B30F50|nr:hypothetical protein [Methylohalobius crimeensis]
MNQEILIAIIAASAAVFGAVVSQITAFAISAWDKKHQKKVLLRQKYEEMMFYFSASLGWVPIVNGCKTLHEISSCSQSPDPRKVLSLCLLYFPDLSDAANAYILGQQAYYASIISRFKDSVGASAGAQAFVSAEHKKVMDQLFERKNELEHLIVFLAKKYVKA